MRSCSPAGRFADAGEPFAGNHYRHIKLYRDPDRNPHALCRVNTPRGMFLPFPHPRHPRRTRCSDRRNRMESSSPLPQTLCYQQAARLMNRGASLSVALRGCMRDRGSCSSATNPGVNLQNQLQGAPHV
jgi:hypothetical protein